ARAPHRRETRTSTCRSFATISSGLYRFLAIAVLLDVKDIPQVGPLQWGWITSGSYSACGSSTSVGEARATIDWRFVEEQSTVGAPIASYSSIAYAKPASAPARLITLLFLRISKFEEAHSQSRRTPVSLSISGRQSKSPRAFRISLT